MKRRDSTSPLGDHVLVGEALARRFREDGLALDGEYSDRWVEIRVGPIKLSLPNSQARTRQEKLHDLHHVVTGYKTDLYGEAEIAAWELGSGCRDYVAAWVLNLAALPSGALVAPKRTLAAFQRGRHTRNLYGRDSDYPTLLGRHVEEVRHELGLDHSVSAEMPALDAIAALRLAGYVSLGFPVGALVATSGILFSLWRKITDSQH
jgi:hypothetical protein